MQPHKRTQSGPLSRNEYETSQSGLLASFGGAGLSAIQRSFQPRLLVAGSTSVNLAAPPRGRGQYFSVDRPGSKLSTKRGRRIALVVLGKKCLKHVKIRLDLTLGNRAYGTLRQHRNKHDPWFMGTSPPPMKDLNQSLCLVYVSLDLNCSRDHHACHPRSFRTFLLLTTSHEHLLYLSQRLKYFNFDILGGRKLLCLGLGGFHLLLQDTRYRAFLLL